MEDKMAMPPAVNSLLSTPSISQSVLLAREPPTEREKGPLAAISLLALLVKKLQSELEAERQYCQALEAHIRALQGAA